MFLSEWREFPSAPCLGGGGGLMTARVSMLLKLRASLTCFRTCVLPGQAKDLSAPLYTSNDQNTEVYLHRMCSKQAPCFVALGIKRRCLFGSVYHPGRASTTV